MHQKIKFISMKIHKIVTTRAAHFGPDMYQIVCRLGLRPRPHWGSLKRSPPPDPLAGLKGLLLREGRGRKGEGRGGAATSTFASGGTNARAATARTKLISTAALMFSVSYPVQESRATSTYGDQGFLTSFKAMSCSSSISRVGRSKLEEDGVTSCVPHVVY